MTRSGWIEIGDRVWIRRYEFVDQTQTVIGGASGFVAVDTRSMPSHANELIADIRELGPAPIFAAINTHAHWDHAFGNAQFVPAPIWAHVNCDRMLREVGLDRLERLLADETLTDEADGFRDVVITPPSDLFEESATLDLGDRQVELRHLGRGHTDNDIVVIVPDAGVLAAGDLLENGAAPSYGDAFPIAWVETARRVLGLVDDAVAPGHGDVMDRGDVERQVAEIGAVAELARAAVSGAIGLDEAIRQSPFPAETTSVAIERARLELAG